MTYHVLPIGVATLVIYLFSLYLSSSGFTGRNSHRRFWNWILLASFTATALIGLFLALKINYKWNIPVAGSLLPWHVEMGIAMAFAAIIHLTWHTGYYLRSGRHSLSEGTGPGSRDTTPVQQKNMVPLLFLTGFMSSSSQFILMRETAILAGGTEAGAGLFLWLWLIIAAAGALAGSRSQIANIRRMIWTLIVGTAMSPVIFVLMNVLILIPGQTPSFPQMLVIVALSIVPVTFISSLVFVRFSSMRQQAGAAIPGKSFGTETTGSVTAGLMTTLTVTVSIPNYQLYILILLVSTILVIWVMDHKPVVRITALAVLIPVAVVSVIIHPDRAVRSMLLRGVQVETSIDTPFGNITKGVYGGENTIFYDHRPLFFMDDMITAEENIHYAMLQREGYDKVILISGGLKRHLPELSKYDIRELCYLEPDPGLLKAEGAHDTVCGTMSVRVERTDPVTFMRESAETYDAVLQLIPPPSTLSVNRFYTAEYFLMVKDHLSENGIFMCTPMPWYNYSPESYRQGFSPLYNAMTGVFSHVTIIPGTLLYAIASGKPLTSGVVRLAEEHALTSNYVNSDYLDDDDIRARRDQVLSQTDSTSGINSASRPVSSLFTNILSLEKMGIKGGIIALLAVLMVIPLIFATRHSLMMFTSSAGLAGFGMIMIFILQTAVGNIYILSAVILSLLMAGLAAGAAWRGKTAITDLKISALLITALFTLTGLLTPTLVTSAPAPVLIFIFIALTLAGFFTGTIYRVLTSRTPGSSPTGRVYAADLAGSALGYLTVATLLVPLAGTANSCFILAAVILASGIVVSVTIRH
jgi:predicted membrane-bound spermidine synthase